MNQASSILAIVSSLLFCGCNLTSTALSTSIINLGNVASTALPTPSQTLSGLSVSITNEPPYGFNLIPGSVRRIHAGILGGTTNAVNWAITSGSGTLSSTSGPYVDLTVGSAGSTCTIATVATDYAVHSATTLTLQAQSQEDTSKTKSIIINVCNPSVQVNIVPFYQTLYAHQKADVQALIWGSTNTNVIWTILSSPAGGDGSLSDTGNRDTVFSATVAGRYVLKATSSADPTRSQTAIMYVTGHALPYAVTPNLTLPVDCTADPALTGTVYEVGPTQTYHTLQSLPLPTLAAGSTIRVHNEDVTGTHPTTFHEYIQISTQGTMSNPIRICGVPDTSGNLPVISGDNATGRSDTNIYAAGYGGITVHNSGWGYYGFPNASPTNIIIEGLKIQKNYKTYTYTPPGGGAAVAYQDFMSGIRMQEGSEMVVRGNEITDNGLGIFNDAQSPESKMLRDVLVEGNNFHNNGVVGQESEHQAYLQAYGQITQMNVFGTFRPGAGGSNLKSRGLYDIIRYNAFSDGSARENDLVDQEDAQAYLSFDGFLGGGTVGSFHGIYPDDTYTADLLASATEVWHHHYIYGNTYLSTTAGAPIHFYDDHGEGTGARQGTLWFYNNTFYAPTLTGLYRWNLFDLDNGGYNSIRYSWGQVQVLNNIVWTPNDSNSNPYFYWTNLRTAFLNFGTTLLQTGWGTNVMSCTDNSLGQCDGTGWPSQTPSIAYLGGGSFPAHVSGFSVGTNIQSMATLPFDANTLIPGSSSPAKNAGSALTGEPAKLPVRFQLNPSTGVVTPRVQATTLGGMDAL